MAVITTETRNQWKRPFFQVWIGQAFSLLGSQLVQFALIWHLTRETGSATVLATATLVAMLPMILIGPLAGSVVDRSQRKRIMILADSGIALATLALAALFAFGLVEVWHIYVLLMLRSLGQAFHGPAMTASTSLMVPKEHLARIQGVNQMLNGGLNIISAPLGALLLELLPMQGVLAIDVVTALIAVVAVLPISIPQPERKSNGADDKPATFWEDFREGFRYVLSWPGLMVVLIMAALINFLLTPAGALLPLLVTKHFDKGVIELGWVNALWGSGVVLGGLLLGVWGGFKKRILTVFSGLVCLGLAAAGMGLLAPQHFTWLLALFLIEGVMGPVVNGSLGAVMQASVDPSRQGRVFTLLTSFATAMTPLGLLVAGPISDAFGIQIWYLIGGGLCALMGLAGFFIPSVMNIEAGHPQELTKPIPETAA
ncbi:MAG: MFS transporter [Anaerolineales bacterium]|nr:MFS transporter [Anaerolineales bacterium]